MADHVPDSPTNVKQYLKILLQFNPPWVKMIKTAGGGKFFRITKEGREVQVFFNRNEVRQLLRVDKPQFTYIDESEDLQRQLRDLTMNFD